MSRREADVDLFAMCPIADPPAELGVESLSPVERRLMRRARSDRRRTQIDVSRRLMRHALRHAPDLSGECLAWGESGPEYRDSGRSIGLSLAHSRRFAAVALSDAGPIGVDIECHRRERAWRRAIDSMFCEADRAWIVAGAGAAAFERFLATWTAREAHAKMHRASVLDRLSSPILRTWHPGDDGDGPPSPDEACVTVYVAAQWTAAICRPAATAGEHPGRLPLCAGEDAPTPRYTFRAAKR